MTKAVVKKQNGLYVSLMVSGHSGYADYGSDIVCAGISTAVISSINLIDKLVDGHFEFTQNDENGLVVLNNINYNGLSNEKLEFINLVFENLIETLKNIEDDYPKYFKIKIENNK